MSTNYYVHKSGNDANNGLTLGTAKKTIGGGMAAFAAGGVDGVINVYRGVYKEAVTMIRNFDASLEVRAIGHVIIDGENVRAFGLDFGFPSDGNGSLNSTYRGFEVRNCTDVGIRSRGNNLGAPTSTGGKVRNCVIHDCPKGVNYATNSAAPGGIDVQDSIIFNCSVAGVWGGEPNSNVTIVYVLKNNTFYNCLAGFQLTATNVQGVSSYNNVYLNCTTGIVLPFTVLNLNLFNRLDYDDFFGCTNVGKLLNTTYATLALFRAAIIAGWSDQYGPYTDVIETHGIETDPLVIDAPKYLFGLRAASPCLATGLNSADIGARGKSAFAQSFAFSPTDWANGLFSSTQINGSNQIELIAPATLGTYTSVVFDLGAGQTLRITGFDLSADETEPADVVDTDNNDTAPNKKNIEVRMSETPFIQTDAILAWQKIEQDVTPPATLAGRYIQYRLTLRKDGVEA